MKKITYIFLVFFLFFLTSCDMSDFMGSSTPKEKSECEHENITWEVDGEFLCGELNHFIGICDDCGKKVKEKNEIVGHDYEITEIAPTCISKGYTHKVCLKCGYEQDTNFKATVDHEYINVIEKYPVNGNVGIMHTECKNCDYVSESFNFMDNDFVTHGALHVTGIDLMDQNNEKFRLAGVSTFGLQWQPEYVNYETFKNLKETFGANVIRLANYTGEGGYCSSEYMKEVMYQRVVNGINIATSLNMYVIVDWHMLGVDEGDNNPLFYLDEAMEFFDRITEQFSDHDNILFEIMNEPCYCTWADCKSYAEQVIPVIRKNMPNAIVLVGNPQWTSDLASVAKNPLKGYTNIMYAFHFYAGDNSQISKIVTACGTNKLPVFVTEHGGMDADGDGPINYTSLKKWYDTLDTYNISMVAWSLSNLNTTSCMFKTDSTLLSDFSDSNLKEWGIIYKNHVRKIMGLPFDEEYDIK